MDISTAEIKAIAETLPIGLYTKRRIPMSIAEGEKTSYYNMVTDEIVISADIIKAGLKYVANKAYIETAIRSMLYHEVAHTILTPRCLEMTEIRNIFEDERIETLLQNYFFNVDFKTQVLHINGFNSLSDIPTITPSTPAMTKFYYTVRFGIGEPAHIEMVNNLINKYARFTTNTTYWDVYDYKADINDLYRKITGEEPPYSKKSDPTGGFGSPMDGADGSSSSDGKDKGDDSDADGMGSGSGTEEADTEATMGDKKGTPAHGRANPLSAEEISAIAESIFNGANPYIDNKLTEELGVIISNFSKKNNSGSAVAGYSGVLNPRSASRNDYKYFDRKSSINGTNKFGTLHLNLFIDSSGSFCPSETIMNTLLHSLTELEKRNQNFSLDVVFCGHGEELVTDKRKRVFEAGGGNRLTKEIYGIYRKLQKPNTYNYNIVCFDGDAYSDGGRDAHGFGAFDHSNCTIISDEENKRYISKDVHSARVIYTEQYTDELIKNITDTLAKAFR